MIGIVIPAHNEADSIERCLGAVRRAAIASGEDSCVVVVCDACSDDTARRAASLADVVLEIDVRNVGSARAAGCEEALLRGADWLATTDADSVVSPHWLREQRSLDADAVCGTVEVDDWDHHGAHADTLRTLFRFEYRDVDGHRHIHGANLGVSAEAYRRCGGFAAKRVSEDVALVEALTACGARIAWSDRPRVSTSSRFEARARDGFGHTLKALLDAHLAAPSALTAN